MKDDRAKQQFYCQMCGGEPIEGTVTCENCKPVYFALHAFVEQWEKNLSKAPAVQEALLASVAQYDPQTGQLFSNE